MKFWVGVTDNEWFRFLARLQPDEVNFWQPSGTPPFKFTELFLFKLHSPENFIVGGGYFVNYSRLPVSIAWEAFGQKNGVSSHRELSKKIIHYRESRKRHGAIDPEIGCCTLTEPFFFKPEDWIPIPSDWKSNIVRGKFYDTETEIGAQLWSEVEVRLNQLPQKSEQKKTVYPKDIIETADRYTERLTKYRLGQGAFRTLVTEAYQRRCTITGEKTLPVLDAAHIKPYSESGLHHVKNGLLMRADLHRLFDRFYLTVTSDLHLEVSPRIKQDYGNGREYYAMHGEKLKVLPESESQRPSREYLDWHNNKFGEQNVVS